MTERGQSATAATGDRFEWERAFRLATIKPPTRKLVGYVLWGHAGRDGGDIFPSAATLAEQCGISVRQAEEHRRELINAGWFVKIGGHRPGGRGIKLRTAIPSRKPASDKEAGATNRRPASDKGDAERDGTLSAISGDSLSAVRPTSNRKPASDNQVPTRDQATDDPEKEYAELLAQRRAIYDRRRQVRQGDYRKLAELDEELRPLEERVGELRELLDAIANAPSFD